MKLHLLYAFSLCAVYLLLSVPIIFYIFILPLDSFESDSSYLWCEGTPARGIVVLLRIEDDDHRGMRKGFLLIHVAFFFQGEMRQSILSYSVCQNGVKRSSELCRGLPA